MPASRVVVVESSQSSLHVPVLSGMHAHSVRRPVAGHSESIISSCRARSVHARCGRRDAGRINGSILWWLLLRSAQRETLVLCLLAHSTSSATQYCFPCFITACACRHVALSEAQSPCVRHPCARRLQCVLAGHEARARKSVHLRFLRAVVGKLKLLFVVLDVLNKPV